MFSIVMARRRILRVRDAGILTPYLDAAGTQQGIPAYTTAALSHRYRALAQTSATPAIPNSILTTLAFDGADIYDVGNLHSPTVSNTRMTVPAGSGNGAWLLVGSVTWANNVAGIRELAVFKNGSLMPGTYSQRLATGVTPDAMQTTACDSSPNPGDYYEIVVGQSSGGNLNVNEATFLAVNIW